MSERLSEPESWARGAICITRAQPDGTWIINCVAWALVGGDDEECGTEPDNDNVGASA